MRRAGYTRMSHPTLSRLAQLSHVPPFCINAPIAILHPFHKETTISCIIPITPFLFMRKEIHTPMYI